MGLLVGMLVQKRWLSIIGLAVLLATGIGLSGNDAPWARWFSLAGMAVGMGLVLAGGLFFYRRQWRAGRRGAGDTKEGLHG